MYKRIKATTMHLLSKLLLRVLFDVRVTFQNTHNALRVTLRHIHRFIARAFHMFVFFPRQSLGNKLKLLRQVTIRQ